MTWFKVDGRKPMHPKFIKAGRDASNLWDVAGPLCADVDSDGFVDPDMIEHFAGLARIDDAKAAVRSLVKVRLWHDQKTIKDCERCLEAVDGGLKRGWFYFHDWNDYNLAKAGKNDPLERKRERRRRDLNRSEAGKAVKAAVRVRDRDFCRYCGTLTHWGHDHKSPSAGTIDHIDPFDWVNSVVNCVVACRKCNGRKRDRTPEQAKMTLRPEPDPVRIGSGTGSVPDPASGTASGTPSRDARDGPGSGRSGSGTGYGSDPDDPRPRGDDR